MLHFDVNAEYGSETILCICVCFTNVMLNFDVYVHFDTNANTNANDTSFNVSSLLTNDSVSRGSYQHLENWKNRIIFWGGGSEKIRGILKMSSKVMERSVNYRSILEKSENNEV